MSDNTRIFKIGGETIHEDDSMTSLSSEEARRVLQRSYPEIANATIRETEQDGQRVVEFLPKPGRKG
jgi:hypothetical protein